MAGALPRITIVTPSFQQGRFLEETICSVLAQGYPDLEYFVVDGGSRDGSREVIERWAGRLDWWVSEPDRGHADAVNKGMARATGEVVGFLNSDDLLLEGALLKVGEHFAAHPRTRWLAGASRYFADEPLPPGCPHRIEVFAAPPRPSRWDFLVGCPIAQPSVFWRRDVIEEAGPFTGELLSLDYAFYLRLLALGLLPEVIPDVLSGFRLHASSISVSRLGPALEANRALALRSLPALLPPGEVDAARARLEALFDLERVPQLVGAGHRAAALRGLARALRREPRLLGRRQTWGSLLRATAPGPVARAALGAYHASKGPTLSASADAERRFIRAWRDSPSGRPTGENRGP